MEKMFWVYNVLVLIATWFVTTVAYRVGYAAVMCFCSFFPGQGRRIERLFKKFTDDGLKFMGGSAIATIGVGKGTEILDHSPLTIIYLVALNITGLLSFSLAPSNGSRDILILYSFLGISARLAIMGLCSSHYIFSDRFGFIVVIMSPLYVLLMIFKPLLTRRLFGMPVPDPQAGQPPQTDREILLESWAKQGAIYTSTTGIALLATDCCWGRRIEPTPTLIWIAVCNAGAFWAFQGALLLDRGRLFETWVLGGIIMSLSMTISGLLYIFTPTPQDFNVLLFCTLAILMHHKCDWIEANVYVWFLNRQRPAASLHDE